MPLSREGTFSVQRAKRVNLLRTTLKLKAWKAEVADLTQKKSRLYGSLQTLKAEVQEAEAVKVRGTGGTAVADQSQDAEQTA